MLSLMNFLLAAVLLVSCLQLALFVFVLLKAWAKARSIEEQIDTFFRPPAEGELSPFAKVVDAVSIAFGRALITQVKALSMQSLSSVARMENAENIKQNPILGLMGAFLGKKTLATLARNPGIVDFVTQQFGSHPLRSNNNGGGPPPPESGEDSLTIK